MSKKIKYKKDLATPCSHRIYTRHRTMLKEIACAAEKDVAEILRIAIEEKYERFKEND